MIITIDQLFTDAELTQVRALLAQASWSDGLITAGSQAARTKNNQQLADFNCFIPASVVAVWGISNSPIDEYILSQYPRFKKQD